MSKVYKLPYKKQYLSSNIYKPLSEANFALGELKGLFESCKYIETIMRYINTIESKSSSEIDGLFTTYDDLFKSSIMGIKKETSKEVSNLLRANRILFKDTINMNKITIDSIDNIQRLICPQQTGLRELRGHKIYNKVTGEVLYVPPQNLNAIKEFLINLIEYINTPSEDYDPLVQMAIIHYQFECIHPYKKGNGRIGRILNTMSLVQNQRLTYPILNLSMYMIDTKEQYFSILSKCHQDIRLLDEFIIYILKGIKEVAQFTINFTKQLLRIIEITREDLACRLPKIYSEDLLIHLFMYPYTKNETFRIDLSLSRTTATKYLKTLVHHGFIEEEKDGKEVIYKNVQIKNLFE